MKMIITPEWAVRVVVLVVSAMIHFGIILPNAGPFPEMQPNAVASQRAALAHEWLMVCYVLSFVTAAGFILVGAKRQSRWEMVGWMVLVAMFLLPALKL